MQLQEVRIQNFRNFDDFTVRLEDFSVIIGANNLGKTNFLEALGYVFAPTSARNVRVTKQDFHNPAHPIIIDVVFGNLTETDKAAFFHEEGLINPGANTITIRFESRWSSTEQDVVNECYFVRDDLDSVQRSVDFTRRFKEHVPFFAISASRSAAQEVGVSPRKDFGKIMRLFADDYLKPIEALWQDVSDKRQEVQEEKERWQDSWEEFPEDEFKCVHAEIQNLLSLIQDSIIGQNLEDGSTDIQNDLITAQEGWNEARNSLQEALRQLEDDDTAPMFFESVEDLLTKTTVLLNRCNAQLALFNLRDGMLSNQHFGQLNAELNSVFGEILPGQDVGLNLFPIQDDELISRVSVDINDFPLLRHGSGYQSVFVIGVKLMRTLSQLQLSKGVDVRNFILAVEEPEVHLHPHMQRHLVKSLHKLQTLWAERGYALQVICTTHSPSIVSRIRSHQLVVFHRNVSGTTSVVKWSENELERIVEEFEPDETKRGRRYDQLRNWAEFFLERYADVFFSNCVIVVEGDTEEGAIPIWAGKLTPPVDFDQLGVSFINTEGGDKMGYTLKILDEFGVDHTCLHDRGDDHEVDVSSGGVHATQGDEFEDDVLISVKLSSILKAVELVSSESSNANRLGWIRGHIDGCENFYETQDLVRALDAGNLEEDQVDRLRREMGRWIKQPKIKSLAFGRALAQMTSEDEIPEICRVVIEDAANRARHKIGVEHG
jgi:predicted ATP-dependent endonuclease of OLD family